MEFYDIHKTSAKRKYVYIYIVGIRGDVTYAYNSVHINVKCIWPVHNSKLGIVLEVISV